jgi:hypothetical protein
MLTWCCFTPTVTTRRTPGSTIDKAPRTEEPDECESLTSGSEPAAGWATAPPTVTSGRGYRVTLRDWLSFLRN